MTEILTESFCERCGTRYTFESARPRVRLKGVKTVSRGLKNFVLSDETSMDEAMAAARADTEREATSYQLDAFHKTFNFCMSCRQYTCPNCWNEAEARCLTCAPHLGRDVLAAPFPDLAVAGAVGYEDLTAGGAIRVEGNGAHPTESVPAAPPDDEIDVAARLAALTMTFEPREVAEPEGVVQAEPVIQPEPVVQSDAVVQPDAVEPLQVAAVEPVHVAALETEAVAEPEPVVEPEYVDEPALPLDLSAETAAIAGAHPESEPLESEPEPIASEPEPIESEPAVDLAAAVLLADHDPREDAPAALVAPAKPAGRSRGFFHRFRPGQDIDAELDAYEREHAAAAAAGAAALVAAQPEPVEAVVEPEEIAEPESVVAAQPQPIEAVVEPEEIAEPQMVVAAQPEPIEAVVEPEEIAEPEVVVAAEPEPVEAVVVADEIAEPEPVVAAEPEPLVAAEPEPVVAAEPEPVVGAEPEPVVGAEPEPVVAAEPEPVVAAEPEPVV
ncbi:MAG: hypothetical protein ACJ769_02790, partial [Chloroflexota bacterium]